MSVDVIDSVGLDREYAEMRVTQGPSISSQDSRVSSLPLSPETRQNGFFSLKNSSHTFRPMMSHVKDISISYEHTSPDGSKDGVDFTVTFKDQDTINGDNTIHDIDPSECNTDES